MAFALVSQVEQDPSAPHVRGASALPVIVLPKAVTTPFWALTVVLGHLLLLWLLLNLSPLSSVGADTHEATMLVVSIADAGVQEEVPQQEQAPAAPLEQSTAQPASEPSTVPEWSIEQVRVQRISDKAAQSPTPPSNTSAQAVANTPTTRARSTGGGQYDPYAGVAPMRQNMLPQGPPPMHQAPPSPKVESAADRLQPHLELVQAELRRRFPNDRGMLVARISISPTGTITHVDVLRSTISPSARIAAISALRRMRVGHIEAGDQEVRIILS